MHKPNVTVAAVVRCNDNYLLVKEKDKQTGQIVYNQPAGHLEKNETLIEAAVRELKEEAGLSLYPKGLIGIYNLHASNQVHYLRFCFYFETDEPDETSPEDRDIIDACWLNLAEIESMPLRSDLVLRCINDSRTRTLSSLDIIYDPKT